MAGVGQGVGAGQRGKGKKRASRKKSTYQVEKKNHWLSGTTSGSNSLCLFYSIYIATVFP